MEIYEVFLARIQMWRPKVNLFLQRLDILKLDPSLYSVV
jgi:hypothetical protein